MKDKHLTNYAVMRPLIDKFVYMHFKRVYDFISHGNRSHEWEIDAKKEDVFVCIHEFFKLCFDAEKEDDYANIKDWVLDLLKIACAQKNHGIISVHKYRMLIIATDQISKYLISRFDWHIDDWEYYRTENPIESFDDRIRLYKSHYPNDKVHIATAKLLYSLKGKRNTATHSAKRFYGNRLECLQELVKNLYYFITVFYVLSHYDKERHGLNLKSQYALLVDNFKVENFKIDILVKCNDKSVDDKDIRLYKVNANGESVDVGRSGKGFSVLYFAEYKVQINGVCSDKFTIDESYMDESVIVVDSPPTGGQKPVRVPIEKIIVYSENDIPDEIKILIAELDSKIDDSNDYAEVIDVVRSLVLASSTNNEQDMDVFKEALAKMKNSLNNSKDINRILSNGVKDFQQKMTKLYENNIDFNEMCSMIDRMYEVGLEHMVSCHNENLSEVNQIYQNVQENSNDRFSVGTESTQKIIEAHKQLAQWNYIRKYPQIIINELGIDGFKQCVERLYLAHNNFLMDDLILFWSAVNELCMYVKDNFTSEDNELVLSLARTFEDFAAEEPDNVILIARSGIFNYLLDCLDNILKDDNGFSDIKRRCNCQINNLIQDDKYQLLKIPVENADDKKLVDSVFNNLNERVNFLNKRTKCGGELMGTVLDKVRYGMVCHFASKCTPELYMQIVCTKWRMDQIFLCGSLGVSGDIAWREENCRQLQKCIDDINALMRRFGGRERTRFRFLQNDVDKKSLSIIWGLIEDDIKKKFGADKIPVYIMDIMDSKALTDQSKLIILLDVQEPGDCEFENHVSIVYRILQYWYFFNRDERFIGLSYNFGLKCLRNFITKGCEEFPRMKERSRVRFLKCLMKWKHTMAVGYGETLLVADDLNREYGGIIPFRDFYMNMSDFRPGKIFYYDFNSFEKSREVIERVTEYSNSRPDDVLLANAATAQKEDFLNLCEMYFNSKVEKTGNGDVLFKDINGGFILRLMYATKNLFEKYNCLFDWWTYKYKNVDSAWCKEEEKLFSRIMQQLSGDDSKSVSSAVISNYTPANSFIPADVKAERLMALRQFYNEEDFKSALKSFYSNCTYGKITIYDKDVRRGLEKVSDLFKEYGQGIEVIYNGSPTSFVDILIAMYDVLHPVEEG